VTDEGNRHRQPTIELLTVNHPDSGVETEHGPHLGNYVIVHTRAEEYLRAEHRLAVADAAEADLGQCRVEQVGPVTG
jgi:hypothetical protein